MLVRLRPLCALLAACVLVLSLPATAQAPPQWLDQLNPADYVLVQPDLTGPLAGYKIDGDINAEARATEYAVTAPGGQPQGQRTFILWATENVTSDPFHRNQAKDRDDKLVTLTWAATWEIMVEVYETPEVAKLVADGRWGGGFGREYNDTVLGHPALRGKGESTADGDIVRFHQCIFRITNFRISEVQKNRGSMWMDVWNKARDEAVYKASQTQATLARAWIDKISRLKPPELPDLLVQPDWILLVRPADNNILPTEPAADRQSVAFTVKNASATIPARNVFVQLSLAQPGDDLATPLGDPIPVGDLAPNTFRTMSTVWDLQGRNLEKGLLYVQTWIPGTDDDNPDDNVAGLEVSIYYAHNGNRAFSFADDSYRFVNYGFEDREIEETIEGVLTTVIGNMSLEGNMTALLQRLFFPQTYLRVKAYFDESTKMAAGGHCYGMSATAALYFEDPLLKPVPQSVPDMSQADASFNINLYHRAQMVPVIESAITGRWYVNRDLSVNACRSAIKQLLRDNRECSVIEFFGQNAGHAVLAYKLIEVEGRDPVVYVYDPNFPVSLVQPPRAMSQIRLLADGSTWSNPPYMGYNWANAQSISARRPHRTMPLDEVSALVPPLKQAVQDMIAFMKQADKIMALLRCPADAVLTDPQGRRVGMVAGKPVNEIPGAEIRSEGEVEIYVLPANLQYSVSITGNSSGQAGFDLIRAVAADQAGLVSFQALPVSAGAAFQGTLPPGGQMQSLQAGGRTFAPQVSGVVDLGRLPTQTVLSPDEGDLIVCRDVVDGKPQGAASHFDQIGKIFAFLSYRDLPDNTLAQVSWKRGGQEFSQGERAIGGTGWVWFSVSTTRAGGYEPGTYEVTLQGGGRVLGRKTFTVGAATSAPATPTTPTTPTGEPELIFEIGNIYAVQNGATKPSQFTLDRPRTLTQIRTYHWNNARGAQPGTIALRDTSGRTWGPWQATGEPGQGGVPNAYWVVKPNVTLPAGEYTVVDSDPQTWSQNSHTQGRGMVHIYALPVGSTGTVAAPTSTAAPATTTPPSTPAAPTVALALTQPQDGQKVDKAVIVRGTAPAGATVRITVKHYFKILVEGYRELLEEEVRADAAGNWCTAELDFSIPLVGMARDYQIIAELLDDQGRPAQTKKITVKGK